MSHGILPDGSTSVIVHLAYTEPQTVISPDGRESTRMVERIACSPDRKLLATCPGTVLPCMRTTNLKTVTCPLCKDTTRYLDAKR